MSQSLKGGIAFNLEKIANVINTMIPFGFLLFGFSGYKYNFNFHFLTVVFFFLTLINFYYVFNQKKSTLLSNFGIIAQLRYMIESVSPEFRQYLFLSDTWEKPSSQVERSGVYRKEKKLIHHQHLVNSSCLISMN